MMTMKRQVQLKGILEALHGRLVLEIADALRVAAGDPIDSGESSSGRTGHGFGDDVIKELIGIKTAMLHRLDDALVRLDAGSFGVCCECGQDIAEDRLKIDPFTTRCTACEEADGGLGNARPASAGAHSVANLGGSAPHLR